MLIHSYKWFDVVHNEHGNYYHSSEAQFHDFALFYGLQEISVKAAAWRLMNKGMLECMMI